MAKEIAPNYARGAFPQEISTPQTPVSSRDRLGRDAFPDERPARPAEIQGMLSRADQVKRTGDWELGDAFDGRRGQTERVFASLRAGEITEPQAMDIIAAETATVDRSLHERQLDAVVDPETALENLLAAQKAVKEAVSRYAAFGTPYALVNLRVTGADEFRSTLPEDLAASVPHEIGGFLRSNTRRSGEDIVAQVDEYEYVIGMSGTRKQIKNAADRRRNRNITDAKHGRNVKKRVDGFPADMEDSLVSVYYLQMMDRGEGMFGEDEVNDEVNEVDAEQIDKAVEKVVEEVPPEDEAQDEAQEEEQPTTLGIESGIVTLEETLQSLNYKIARPGEEVVKEDGIRTIRPEDLDDKTITEIAVQMFHLADARLNGKPEKEETPDVVVPQNVVFSRPPTGQYRDHLVTEDK